MPPTVKRQAPAGAARAPRPVPPPEDDAWGSVAYMKVLLYGQSGTGKTTFAATFPDPILWLLCSGGDNPGELLSIDTPENRRRVTPRAVEDSGQLFAHLAAAVEGHDPDADPGCEGLGRLPCRYRTVVLDHASGLSDMVLGELLGRRVPAQKAWGLASQQQYGQLGAQLKDTFRKLLNLRANVVIVAQERVFGGREDGGDPEILRPTVGAALTPSVTGWLNPACDYVLQAFKRPRTRQVTSSVAGKDVTLTQREKGVDYCLRCEPHDVFTTKFRVPRGRELPDAIVDPTYDKVRAVIEGRPPRP